MLTDKFASFHLLKTRALVLIIVTAILYITFGQLGYFLEKTNLVVHTIFIPEGIALALGIMFGPIIAVGVILGQFLLSIFNGLNYLTAFMIASGNALALLLALKALTCFPINLEFNRMQDYARLILISFFLSAPLSALIGNLALVISNEILFSQIMANFTAWWMGNSQAHLIVTPLIILLMKKYESLKLGIKYYLPTVSVFILLSLELYYDFSDFFPFIILVLPLLTYIVFLRHFSLLLIVSFVSLLLISCATTFGLGPLAHYMNFSFIILNFIAYGVLLPLFFSCVLLREKDCLENNIRNYAAQQKDKAQTRETQLLKSLNTLSATRDNETGNHIIRTQIYVKKIALQLRQMGHYVDLLDDEFIDRLYHAAPLHDIGKVGIPDHILQKPGKLTDSEWVTMKTHTTLGEDILNSAIETDQNTDERDLLKIAKDIAGGHHEKWDGSGYPRGLMGVDIPLSARMMALADMYDALVCKRVYKEAWTHEAAAQEINQLSGSHLDPAVVEAFNAISEEFKQIARDYTD